MRTPTEQGMAVTTAQGSNSPYTVFIVIRGTSPDKILPERKYNQLKSTPSYLNANNKPETAKYQLGMKTTHARRRKRKARVIHD